MKVKLDKNMEEFLGEFELSDREVAIYLTLLKTGPNTIMNLARETGIKRSTTHNNVEELIKKGLVSQTNYGERRMVVAESPEKLQFLLDQKKFKVQKLEKNLPAVIDQINSLVPDAAENTRVEVKYYDRIEDIKSIYESTLDADEVYSFVNIDKFYEVFPESLGLQAKAMDQNKSRKVWDIMIESDRAKDIATKGYDDYNLKVIPAGLSPFGFEFIIFGDNVAILQLEKANPLGILIKSSAISQGLKMLHQTMWNLIDIS